MSQQKATQITHEKCEPANINFTRLVWCGSKIIQAERDAHYFRAQLSVRAARAVTEREINYSTRPAFFLTEGN